MISYAQSVDNFAKQEAKTAAYNAGRQASLTGQPHSANPYHSSDLNTSWQTGHNDGTMSKNRNTKRMY